MFRFLLNKMALLVPTLIGVTLLAFALVRALPGDPILVMMGTQMPDEATRAQMAAALGLDKPWPVQYGLYMERLLQGDLGRSSATGQPVIAEFWARFPATLELVLWATAVAIVVGITVGVIAALHRGRWPDQALMSVTLVANATPVYLLGLLAILVFSVQMREWLPALALPVSGRISIDFDVPRVTGFLLIDSLLSDERGAFRSVLRHLVLPGTVLGLLLASSVARMTRSSILETLGQEYVRAARSRNLSPWRVVVVHALRNALIPVITLLGLLVGTLMGGAVLTETIFGWPGIGNWLVSSIFNRDYAALQGGILLLSVLVIGINLLVDLAYGLIDPRIRHPRS